MSTIYEAEMFALMTGLISGIPSLLLGIAAYVLNALALYTISRRRGLNKPWLAWIPVVNCWLLGSLSDQYRYVVKGENRSKRKWLLILNILMFALTAAIVVMIIVVAAATIMGNYHFRARMTADVTGLVIGILGLCLPMAGIAIAYKVIRFMALYDLYRSLDPENSVLYLVLSILFSIPEPFFLFFNRNKDNGMPPRKQEPAREFWENENKDYL